MGAVKSNRGRLDRSVDMRYVLDGLLHELRPWFWQGSRDRVLPSFREMLANLAPLGI
jgi:hypothetical protein